MLGSLPESATTCHSGDQVFVEAPAYYNLFGLLHLAGLASQGVPRTAEGPDLDVLEAKLRQGERPRPSPSTPGIRPAPGCASTWPTGPRRYPPG